MIVRWCPVPVCALPLHLRQACLHDAPGLAQQWIATPAAWVFEQLLEGCQQHRVPAPELKGLLADLPRAPSSRRLLDAETLRIADARSVVLGAGGPAARPVPAADEEPDGRGASSADQGAVCVQSTRGKLKPEPLSSSGAGSLRWGRADLELPPLPEPEVLVHGSLDESGIVASPAMDPSDEGPRGACHGPLCARDHGLLPSPEVSTLWDITRFASTIVGELDDAEEKATPAKAARDARAVRGDQTASNPRQPLDVRRLGSAPFCRALFNAI